MSNRVLKMVQSITYAVIYIRVSSKEQEEEGFSLAAQLALLEEYAESQGLVVTKVFQDVETAKTTGRKEFQNMIEFLRKNGTQCRTILVEKTDRLTRNLTDAAIVYEDLKVDVHAVKEREIITPSSPSSKKFMFNMKVIMAKNLVDNLSEEVVKGMTQKAKTGIWPSQAPLGYINVEIDKRKIIVPDPERKHVIKRIFELYATGNYSMSDITGEAYAEGLRYRSNRKVNKSVIHKILTNPIYCGEFYWNGKLYEGTYEKIISKDLFNTVQAVIAGKGSRPSNPLTRFFAFQGMVTCGKCGCAMVAEMKKGKYIYYHCTQNHGKCPGKWVREEVLDQHFLKSVEAIQIDQDVAEYMVRIMKERSANERQFHEDQIAKLRKKNVALEQQVENMYFDKLQGVITAEQFLKYSENIRSEIQHNQDQVRRHEAPNFTYLDDASRVLELAQKAASLYSAQNMEERRKLLKIVHSNSTWEDEKLTPNYRKPFDILVDTNVAYKQKKATSPEKSGLLELWLPSADSNHGHGG